VLAWSDSFDLQAFLATTPPLTAPPTQSAPSQPRIPTFEEKLDQLALLLLPPSPAQIASERRAEEALKEIQQLRKLLRRLRQPHSSRKQALKARLHQLEEQLREDLRQL
jgi:hypothetical protein